MKRTVDWKVIPVTYRNSAMLFLSGLGFVKVQRGKLQIVVIVSQYIAICHLIFGTYLTRRLHCQEIIFFFNSLQSLYRMISLING